MTQPEQPEQYERDLQLQTMAVPNADGTLSREFQVVLSFDADHSAVLSEEVADAYVAHLAAACAAASHEFSLVAFARQVLSLDRGTTATLLHDVRAARGPLPDGVLDVQWAPLTAYDADEPQVSFSFQGENPGQITVTEAMDHMVSIDLAREAARQDTALLSVLMDQVGLAENEARMAVANLSPFSPMSNRPQPGTTSQG